MGLGGEVWAALKKGQAGGLGVRKQGCLSLPGLGSGPYNTSNRLQHYRDFNCALIII